MDDYVDSFEPLIVKTAASSVLKVIDDFNYNLLKRGNFATDYSQLQQKNFVQLPSGLVKPKKVSKTKFEFIPEKPVEEEDEESQPLPEQPSPASQHEMKSSSDSSLSSSSSSQSSSSEDEAMNVLAE